MNTKRKFSTLKHITESEHYFTLQDVRMAQFSANVRLQGDASCLCSIRSQGMVELLFSSAKPCDVALRIPRSCSSLCNTM